MNIEGMIVLEAEKKLQAAKYHLDRMKKTYTKNEEIFIYELESFLVNARSTPDILLEDFEKIFLLGISLRHRLFPDTFEKKAKQRQLPNAINFINWWRREMNRVWVF